MIKFTRVADIALPSKPRDGIGVLLQPVVMLEPRSDEERQRHPAGVEVATELVDVRQRAVIDSGYRDDQLRHIRSVRREGVRTVTPGWMSRGGGLT